MNKISMKKKYRTLNDLDVRVLCVDRKNTKLPVLALVTIANGEEVSCAFTKDGKIAPEHPNHPLNLVEISPYADFKTDDPVMVRDSDIEVWERRYFAHEKDGLAHCFTNGATSWVTKGVVPWRQCRRPIPEELEGAKHE